MSDSNVKSVCDDIDCSAIPDENSFQTNGMTFSLKFEYITAELIPINLTKDDLQSKMKTADDVEHDFANEKTSTVVMTNEETAISKQKKTKRVPPFKCTYCPQRRVTLPSLVDHISVHLGNRQYACNLCEKKYFIKTSLQKHYKKVHLNIKNKICPACSEQFFNGTDLKRHLKKHLC